LPAEHVNVLASEDHPAHLAPLSQMLAGIGGALDRVLAAYRNGDGVAYPEFGAAFRRGQSGINRPAFLNDLVQQWIPAMPDLHAALLAGKTRVADVGCGAGWSTMAMARAYPNAEVIGFDADEASVRDARQHAAARNVQVRFELRDAAELQHEGPFDVVLVLEALHDMARPIDALRAARHGLAPGGSVIVADEKVGDHFHAPADELERLMYGWSIVHCLPVSRAEQPSAAIGTVIRTDIVRALATEAGFTSVDVLPVDGGFFRIYRLKED
jgi:2-polyprenyl-3-methyl-5-hydroxy-6-metoxy-1,4-benzoquinol methylase